MAHYYPESTSIQAQDLQQCRALLRGGSRTFYAASMVLPQGIRDPATALYAFCRVADDAVDENLEPGNALQVLRERLDRVYAQQPLVHPVERAFAAVVDRFRIPRTLPEALIEGFEWDASQRRYANLAELYAYAARVAGTVGSMMALIMGMRRPEVLARACDMGIAMQLTNIARDVGEDARAGRLYLPLDWMVEAGLDPDRWLAHPKFSPALGCVVQRLIEAADRLYARSSAGIAWLPPACRPGMHAARLLYAEIGHEVERNGLNSVAQRAHVAAWRKSSLLLQALIVSTMPKRELSPFALDEVRFLLDAAARDETVVSDAPHTRAAWLFDLFERLERRRLGNTMH